MATYLSYNFMADRNQLVNERNNLRRTYKAVMDKYQKQADTELAPIAEKINTLSQQIEEILNKEAGIEGA